MTSWSTWWRSEQRRIQRTWWRKLSYWRSQSISELHQDSPKVRWRMIS